MRVIAATEERRSTEEAQVGANGVGSREVLGTEELASADPTPGAPPLASLRTERLVLED